MNQKFKQFATAAVEENMTGWSNRIVIKATNLYQKCSIEFESDFGAHKFMDLCRENNIYFTTKQGTADESKHEIRVRPDRTAEARYRNKIMGKLWEQLEKHVITAAPGSKVGQNGPKGKVFVADKDNENVAVIFKIEAHGSNYIRIEVCEDGCKAIGLSEEIARDF
eukprot:6867457-Heterocapsa_arctica.AAC.1